MSEEQKDFGKDHSVAMAGKSRNKHSSRKAGKFKHREKDLPVSDEVNVTPIVYNKVNNHQNSQTVWGQVTLSFLKSTPAYQMFVTPDGKIKEGYSKGNVIRAALYSIGYNIDHWKKYTVKKMVTRSVKDPSTAIETEVYVFPIRKDFKYKDMYKKAEVLTAPHEKSTKVDLAAFGTSFFSDDSEKPMKKISREDLLDSTIENGHI